MSQYIQHVDSRPDDHTGICSVSGELGWDIVYDIIEGEVWAEPYTFSAIGVCGGVRYRISRRYLGGFVKIVRI